MATYRMDVTVTVGIWGRKAGAWQRLTSVNAKASGSYSSGGAKPFTISTSRSAGVMNGYDAYGITVDDIDSGSVSSVVLNGVVYSIQGSGGTRSALASGATTTVTVRPK